MPNNTENSLQVHVELGHITILVTLCDSMLKQGKQCSIEPHVHSTFEMRYIADGSGNYSSLGKSISTKKGDIIIVHPGEYHYQTENEINDQLTQYCVEFDIATPKENSSIIKVKQYNDFFLFLNTLSVVSDFDMLLLPYFKEISKEIQEQQMGCLEKCKSLSTSLLIDFLRISKYQNQNHVFSENGNFKLMSIEAKFHHFFKTQYKYNVTLRDFADSLNFSERHASRLLKEKYGTSFLEKLFETRTKRAIWLIENTDEPLEKIQSSCGFKNYKSFLNNFRKHTGVSPTVYKKRVDSKKSTKKHQNSNN